MDDKQKYVAAIDVGTSKIVALLGKRNENGKLEIVDFVRADSKGMKRGDVQNPELVSGVVRNVVTELQKRTGVIFCEVFVGIAGQHIRILKDRKGFNRPSFEESITNDDIELLRREAQNIALEEGKEILHVLPQSYIVDNETDIYNPIGMLGKRLEANFNIVVGNSWSIMKIKKSITQAELTVKSIILEPLASADAVLYDEEREAGVALVDIGGGTTDIAVFYDMVLRHSAVIPYGGHVVTMDIKEGCGLMEQVAENVKVQYGVAMGEAAEENKEILIPAQIRGREPKVISVSFLANIIQSRMEEIIDAIVFEIENSGYSKKLGYGIVITGGGAQLRYLKDLVSFRTGMEVRVGCPGEHLISNSENINEPSYATGVGLLMKGFEYMDKHQNEMAEIKFADEISEKEEKETETQVTEQPDITKKPRKSIIEGFKEAIARHFDVEVEDKMR